MNYTTPTATIVGFLIIFGVISLIIYRRQTLEFLAKNFGPPLLLLIAIGSTEKGQSLSGDQYLMIFIGIEVAYLAIVYGWKYI